MLGEYQQPFTRAFCQLPIQLTDVTWVLVHVRDDDSLVADECVSTDTPARPCLDDGASWPTLVRPDDEVTLSVLLNVKADPVNHGRGAVQSIQ